MRNLSEAIHNYLQWRGSSVFDLEERNLSWSKFCELIKTHCMFKQKLTLKSEFRLLETSFSGPGRFERCYLGLGILFFLTSTSFSNTDLIIWNDFECTEYIHFRQPPLDKHFLRRWWYDLNWNKFGVSSELIGLGIEFLLWGGRRRLRWNPKSYTY